MPSSRKAHPRRIAVIGSSCGGKTTFAKVVSARLGLPHLELDALFWEPNWREPEVDVFRLRVKEALKPESWIIEGNYAKVQDLIFPRAELLIWIDLPLPVILWRLLRRSLSRTLRRELLWNGCRETLRNSLFSRKSLLFHILSTHRRRNAAYERLLHEPPRSGLKVLRLRSAREVRQYLKALTTA